MIGNPAKQVRHKPFLHGLQAAASAVVLCGLIMGGPAHAADKKPAKKPGTQSIKITPPPIKKRINVEKIYYSQFGLITMATRQLAHERPGIINMYP